MLWKPPEHIRNANDKLTKEGDIYAVGIIMQEVVMRGPPFEKEFQETGDVEGDSWLSCENHKRINGR